MANIQEPRELPAELPVLTPAELQTLTDLFTAVRARTAAGVTLFVRTRAGVRSGQPVTFVEGYLPAPGQVKRRYVRDQYAEE